MSFLVANSIQSVILFGLYVSRQMSCTWHTAEKSVFDALWLQFVSRIIQIYLNELNLAWFF